MTRSTTAIVLILALVVVSSALTYNGDSRWVGHAVTGAAGLGLMIWSLITGAMLAGRIGKVASSNLFNVHRKVTIGFGSLMVWSFVFGLLVRLPHGEPLLTTLHGWLGLSIVVLALLQMVPCLARKERLLPKLAHRIVGYLLVGLVGFQAVLGIEMGTVGLINGLVLLHSTFGGIAAFALVWIIVSMRFPDNGTLRRANVFGWVAAATNIVGCWIIGGYNYLVNYAVVRDAIKAGTEPWAHTILMETKEHVFLFLPIITLALAFLIQANVRNGLPQDSQTRKSIALVAGLALAFVILMFVFGALISNAGRIALGID